MRNIRLVQQRDRLDYLFKQVGSLPDPFLQGHWARYLCVLVSGFLENSVRILYGEYARKKAEPFVANFVDKQLKSIQNPTMGKILDLTRSFNPIWEYNLKAATEGQYKDAVDSIVDNRNKIAHGEDVGIGYVTIQEYYKSAIKVIEIIEDQCDPVSSK